MWIKIDKPKGLKSPFIITLLYFGGEGTSEAYSEKV